MLTLYSKLLVLLVIPTVTGMALRALGINKRWAERLFGFAFYLFQTSITFLAVWSADLQNAAWTLPFITLSGWLLTIPVFLLAEKLFQHQRRAKGSFLFTLCLSNHGYTLLGIVAFVLYGDRGLSQATYAQFFIIPFLVFFCFPAGRWFSGEFDGVSPAAVIRKNIWDKRNIPLLAMVIGLLLNLSGSERPYHLTLMLPVFVYLGTIISGIAVGMLFEASRVLKYGPENLFSFIFRQTLYPLFFFVVGRLAGFEILDLQILVLYGLVPSAVFSNMLADLFDLDRDLTNSVYIIGTLLFLVLTLPAFVLLSEAVLWNDYAGGV